MKTFAELIDLHIEDMKSVMKPPGRSKTATLEMLRRYTHLEAERLHPFVAAMAA